MADPQIGRAMRCGCCHTCNELRREIVRGVWVGTGRCLYGGPFEGYWLPDGTVERLRPNGEYEKVRHVPRENEGA